jgi:hypothetical protein
MKKISINWVAVMAALLSLTSCQKEQAVNPNPVDQTSKSIPNKNTTTGAYILTVNPTTHVSSIYKAGLLPTSVNMGLYSTLSVNGNQLTYANGLAYIGGRFIVTTSSLSNFPNRILVFSTGTIPLTLSNSAAMTNLNISHIEYSPTLGTLYGLDAVAQKINTVGINGVCAPVGPVINPGGGYHLSGLADYPAASGIAVVALDNTTAIDKIIGVNLSTNVLTTLASNNFTPAPSLGLALQYFNTGFYTGTDVSSYKWFYNTIGSGTSPAIATVSPAGLPIADITATN